MDFFRRGRFPSSDLVGQPLVITHGEPILTAVRSARFQDAVQLLDKRFRNLLLRLVDNQVDTTKVVCRLDYIVHVDALVRNADGIRFEYVTGLVMRQPAALYMVGVIGQVDLGAVVDASRQFCLFLFPQRVQQRRRFKFRTSGQKRICGNIPRLADQKCTLYLTRGTVITDCALRNTVFCGELADRDIIHSYRQSE